MGSHPHQHFATHVDPSCSPRGGRPLGSGRQLPPQLTVGRRPLGGGGGHGRGGSRRGEWGGGNPGGSVGGGVQVGRFGVGGGDPRSRPPPPGCSHCSDKGVALAIGGGRGVAQGLHIRLFAFGSAYWPLATAHFDPLWVRTCFRRVNRAPG